MTYYIRGLDPAPYRALWGLSDAALAALDVVRVSADSTPGAPCRISLRDADVGSAMLLINHTSQSIGPYQARHAIFIREGEEEVGDYVDQIPPVFDPRILSLRGFDKSGMMINAILVQPGEAEGGILSLFADRAIAEIHAHNAVRGCFAAKIERN